MAKKNSSGERKFLKIQEVANRFGVSNKTCKKWIDDGIFANYGINPWFTPSGEARFWLDEVDDAIEQSARRGKSSLRDELLVLGKSAKANILVVANNKGGVGKTTVTVNLSHAIAELTKDRVLIVDCDPQCNATQNFGYGERKGMIPVEYSIANIWNLPEITRKPLDEIVVKTKYDNIWLAPMDDNGLFVQHAANVLLMQLANGEIKGNITSIGNVLSDFYSTLSKEIVRFLETNPFDWVIFDTSPGFDPLTTSAIFTSDAYIVPVEPEVFSVYGLEVFENIVDELGNMMNQHTQNIGVVINNLKRSANIRSELTQYIRKSLGEKIFTTVIPEGVSVTEAASQGMTLLEYDPKSKIAESFISLAQEVISRFEAITIKEEKVG